VQKLVKESIRSGNQLSSKAALIILILATETAMAPANLHRAQSLAKNAGRLQLDADGVEAG
jgi:hypothetical protein